MSMKQKIQLGLFVAAIVAIGLWFDSSTRENKHLRAESPTTQK